MKKRLLFVITQFYKGGAEVALLNLFQALSPEEYEIDFLIFDQMILKNAKSLISEVPDWIHVCNAAEKEGYFAVLVKIWFKIYRKLTGRQLCRFAAKRFVKKKEYDAAFSYGEWMSPEFVATKVKAKKKFVWIHTDIDKAKYVNEKILLGYDKDYDKYIFVSEHSKKSAEQRFPIVCGKSVVVHNLCADEEIRVAAQKEADDWKKFKRPILVSVGNLREEKNYPRQLEVLRILKARGIAVTWLCIGSTANSFLYQKLRKLAQEYGLSEDFLFLGVTENPYCYMAKADAVMVLSDFESWSLVITEAKLVGTPVIATPTSGALEQITDKENGRITTSFEPKQIADIVQEYLKDETMRQQMKKNLEGFSTNQLVLEEFLAAIS